MRKYLAVATAAILAVSLVVIADDVRAIKLDELINLSDLIVLGRVVDVVRVGNGRIAKVEIISRLRGDISSASVWYQASPLLWNDLSDGNVGETALLFLKPMKKLDPSEYPDEIRKHTLGEPLFFVAHVGRGRLVSTKIDGENRCYFWLEYGILLPGGLLNSWRPDPKEPGLGTVPLKDLVEYIRKISPDTPRPGLTGSSKSRGPNNE